jgi:hypothetical protein
LGFVCKWKARRGPETNAMKKKIVLQLALQFNFWVASDNCNSPYLYIVSVIEQVAIVARVVIHRIYNATHYNFVTTIPFQLLCNFPMITIIMSCLTHQSKFNTWHYEDFSWLFFKKYWYPSSIMTIRFRWF